MKLTIPKSQFKPKAFEYLRLVQERHPRPGEQRRGELQPLLLAAASLFACVLDFSGSFAQSPQVATGEQIYSDYCSNCHGEGLRNNSGGGWNVMPGISMHEDTVSVMSDVTIE